MRERARDKGRLQDIIEYSDNVTMLIEGYDYDKLVADKRTYYSVMKNIEIVGEAAYMLTKAFKNAHPEIPWKVVQGMRHVLVHDYANVVSATLYDTAINDIPTLRQLVKQYLSETDWSAWESVIDTAEETDNPIYEHTVKTARCMKADGMAVELIEKYTGLNAEVINSL